jgi:DNA-binding beta-propeller fold protein YncE
MPTRSPPPFFYCERFSENTPGSVKVFNITTGSSYTIPGLSNLDQPKGIAVTPSGSLVFVAEAFTTAGKPGRLLVWNRTTGNTAVMVTGSLPNPACIKFDASGNVWVADATANALLLFSSTTFNTTLDRIPGIGQPRDMHPDCNGNVWIADFTTNSILFWDPISRSATTVFTGSMFRQPKG